MAIHRSDSPWAIPVAQVGSRAGQTKSVDMVMPAPSGIGDEYFGIPEGSDVRVEGRIESLADGLLLTATATAGLVGECSRCLKSLDQDWLVQFSAYFPYDMPESTPDFDGDEDIDAGEDEGEDTYPLFENATIMDLESTLRDFFVGSLPSQPLCKPDCLGLCPECGADLNADPQHHHDTYDARWSQLGDLKRRLEQLQGDDDGTSDESGDGTDDDNDAGTNAGTDANGHPAS